MTTTEPAEVVDRLVRRYPGVSAAMVAAVLSEASQTVARLRGEDDLLLAEDLARLRLDIRTHRYA